MADAAPVSKRYLRKAQVQERYSCSAMWIKRHIAADGFPEPTMYVGASPLWSLDALEAWDAEQHGKPRPELVRDMAKVRAARQHG
jgi:predicted DNA-binding transcriptional regulator AlpA